MRLAETASVLVSFATSALTLAAFLAAARAKVTDRRVEFCERKRKRRTPTEDIHLNKILHFVKARVWLTKRTTHRHFLFPLLNHIPRACAKTKPRRRQGNGESAKCCADFRPKRPENASLYSQNEKKRPV